MSGVPSGMDVWEWIVLIFVLVALLALPLVLVSLLASIRSAAWVPPPPTRIAELVGAVDDLIPGGESISRLDRISVYAAAALEELSYNNGSAAASKLELFIAEVETQSGHQLTEHAATELVALAQTIIDTLVDARRR